MPSQATQKLVQHLREAVAMEQSVLRMLASMLRTTNDAALQRAIEEHQRTTRQHIERVQQRLRAYGASPSRARQVGGAVAARGKAVVDLARRDKAARNARDGFANEQVEIASYELLERIAERAGDSETAGVARQNRAEDEAMAKRISDEWDNVASQTVALADGAGRIKQVAGKASGLVRNPLVAGIGSVAVGVALGRRSQQGGGGGQQTPPRGQ